MAQRFTASDMINGLIRVLADRGYSSFLIRTDRLDAAFDAAYRQLRAVEDEYGLDVCFRVALDEFGESSVIRNALNGAAQRDIVSFDNPEFQDMRLDRRKIETTVSLERLPGTRALYETLAESFLEAYDRVDPEHSKQDLRVVSS